MAESDSSPEQDELQAMLQAVERETDRIESLDRQMSQWSEEVQETIPLPEFDPLDDLLEAATCLEKGFREALEFGKTENQQNEQANKLLERFRYLREIQSAIVEPSDDKVVPIDYAVDLMHQLKDVKCTAARHDSDLRADQELTISGEVTPEVFGSMIEECLAVYHEQQSLEQELSALETEPLSLEFMEKLIKDLALMSSRDSSVQTDITNDIMNQSIRLYNDRCRKLLEQKRESTREKTVKSIVTRMIKKVTADQKKIQKWMASSQVSDDSVELFSQDI